jgi:hypothetical protein
VKSGAEIQAALFPSGLVARPGQQGLHTFGHSGHARFALRGPAEGGIAAVRNHGSQRLCLFEVPGISSASSLDAAA